VGVTVVQSGRDHGVNAVGVAKNVIVPKAENPVAFALYGTGSVCIDCIAVLPSVNFDHELRSVACEIGNELADRHLSPKVRIWKGLPQ
jgi:hypothetical protein